MLCIFITILSVLLKNMLFYLIQNLYWKDISLAEEEREKEREMERKERETERVGEKYLKFIAMEYHR